MSSKSIYAILSSITHDIHYLDLYFKYILRCQRVNVKLNKDTYTENHHILPKSLFPEYKSLKKFPWNKSILTARQHFIAHWILARCYNNMKMWCAFNNMCYGSKNHKRAFRISSIVYEELKINKSISTKEYYKTHDHPNKGRTHSEETKKNMSASRIGRTHSEETKKRMSESKMRKNLSTETRKRRSEANSRRTHSEESKKLMSKSKMGENNPNYGNVYVTNGIENRIVSSSEIPKGFYQGITQKTYKLYELRKCPHCGKEGKGGAMTRYHFDNCVVLNNI